MKKWSRMSTLPSEDVAQRPSAFEDPLSLHHITNSKNVRAVFLNSYLMRKFVCKTSLKGSRKLFYNITETFLLEECAASQVSVGFTISNVSSSPFNSLLLIPSSSVLIISGLKLYSAPNLNCIPISSPYGPHSLVEASKETCTYSASLPITLDHTFKMSSKLKVSVLTVT